MYLKLLNTIHTSRKIVVKCQLWCRMPLTAM